MFSSAVVVDQNGPEVDENSHLSDFSNDFSSDNSSFSHLNSPIPPNDSLEESFSNSYLIIAARAILDSRSQLASRRPSYDYTHDLSGSEIRGLYMSPASSIVASGQNSGPNSSSQELIVHPLVVQAPQRAQVAPPLNPEPRLPAVSEVSVNNRRKAMTAYY